MAAADTYDKIDRPYNASLQRSVFTDTVTNIPGTTQEEGSGVIKTGDALNDMTIDTFIKSRSYQPKTQGFKIDAKGGYIECMQLFVGNGGIIGGSLDIPDLVSPAAFHVNNTGTTWWGSSEADGTTVANAYILNTGEAKFKNITIDGSGAGYAAFISDELNTVSKNILADFNFGTTNYAGAVKAGNIVWNTSTGAVTSGSGVAVYRKGIVGANAGTVTFALDATTGSAYFAGQLSAAYGTLGTITSGNIYGATIKTSNTTYPTAMMDSTGVTVHGQTFNLKTSSGGIVGTIGGYTDGDLYIYANNANDIYLYSTTGDVIVNCDALRPHQDGFETLGNASYKYYAVYATQFFSDSSHSLYYSGSSWVFSAGSVATYGDFMASGNGIFYGGIVQVGGINFSPYYVTYADGGGGTQTHIFLMHL